MNKKDLDILGKHYLAIILKAKEMAAADWQDPMIWRLMMRQAVILLDTLQEINPFFDKSDNKAE